MFEKYVRPDSLTWWASLTPLVAGVILALSAALPTLLPVASIINAASGGLPASVLINTGLIGIGLRGAMK